MNIRLRESDYENYDYREFWDKGKRAYEDRSERTALRRLFKGISRQDKTFCDLGCGYGRLFDEYSDFQEIILIDYSLKNLKIARDNISDYLKSYPEKKASVHFIAADVTSVPLKDASLDVIMTVRVLHHIDKPKRYFDEVKRISKPGSEYFLEFANKRNTKNILRFLLGRLRSNPFDNKPLQIGDTILNFHPLYIKGLLDERGFKTIKRISVSNFRSGFLKKTLGIRILNLLELAYQKTIPWLLSGPSVFLKCILEKGLNGKKRYKRINIMDILQCPSCKKGGMIRQNEDDLICENCNGRYSIVEGIFDLR